MAKIPQKIILGTAQFGMEYGISRPQGMLSDHSLSEILLFAHQANIKFIDTAPAYGNAQTRIGKICSDLGLSFHFISKIPKCSPKQVIPIIQKTLDDLKIQKLDATLIHDYPHFQNNRPLWDQLSKAREKNLTTRVGFSLYHPEELQAVIKEIQDCNIVQIPFNIWDQRFAPLLKKADELKIAVHARSIFLQGAFFLNPDQLPDFLLPTKTHLLFLNEFCKNHKISISHLALSFALSQPMLEGVVLGVHSASQLQQNCSAQLPPSLLSLFQNQATRLPPLDTNVLIPKYWKNVPPL